MHDSRVVGDAICHWQIADPRLGKVIQNGQRCQISYLAVHLGWLRRTPWRNRRSAPPGECGVIKQHEKVGGIWCRA